MNTQKKPYRAWCAFNYGVPMYHTIGSTQNRTWKNMGDAEKSLYYKAIEDKDEDLMSIKKIEFQIVKVFTK
jgi:hypothetical protein